MWKRSFGSYDTKKHSCTKISLDLQTNFGFCVDVISFHGVNIASLADLHSA